MRRLAAHLALAIIWMGTLAPLVSAAELSDLPACCRRLGLHHCQDTASTNSSSGTEFRATRAACPYSAPLPLTIFSGLEISKFNVASPSLSGFIAAQHSLPGFRSEVSDLSTRGPPILL